MPPIAARWLNQSEYGRAPQGSVAKAPGAAPSPHIKRGTVRPKVLARQGTAIKEDVIPGYTGYMQNMRQGTASIAGSFLAALSFALSMTHHTSLTGTYENCRKAAYALHHPVGTMSRFGRSFNPKRSVSLSPNEM